MTTAGPQLPTSPDTRQNPPPVRKRICVATILACLPYVGLKAVWVLGLDLGTTSAGFTDASRNANGITGVMDIAAMTLAVLLVHPRGRRVPAFFIAVPLWIGAGLLAPVAGGSVLGTAVQVLTGGGNPAAADDVLQPWVFGAVYAGFALQAVLLGAGLTLYARDRWPQVLSDGRVRGEAGPTTALQNLLARLFVPAALAYAAIQAGWAVAGGGQFTDPTTAQRVMLSLTAALAVGGAVAYAALLRGASLRRRWLVLGFLGTGVVFTGTTNTLITTLAVAPAEWGDSGLRAGEAVGFLFIAFCALGAAIGGALRLVEEQQPSAECGCSAPRHGAVQLGQPSGGARVGGHAPVATG